MSYSSSTCCSYGNNNVCATINIRSFWYWQIPLLFCMCIYFIHSHTPHTWTNKITYLINQNNQPDVLCCFQIFQLWLSWHCNLIIFCSCTYCWKGFAMYVCYFHDLYIAKHFNGIFATGRLLGTGNDSKNSLENRNIFSGSVVKFKYE